MAETTQNSSQSELNNEHIVLSHKKSVSYDVAVMCDKYNAILYNLFIVYSKSYPSGQFQSVDDHLAFLEDYHVIPQFISKERAVTNFMDIVSRYDHGGMIETANYMNYEGFVEGIGRLALIVFSNPSLAQMYSSISMKIAMFIEIWNLGDEATLTIHQQERKLNNQS